jgi:DNA-binding transcriptional LysR family regulator
VDIDRLDWNDLRYFLAAVRAGTLAGAARHLSVKHSTVGRRLTALEEALGAAIFIRGEQGLKLTSTGEKLVPFAEQMERSTREMREQVTTQTARVRVAVPTGLVKLFAPHLGTLQRRHPEIVLAFLSSSQPADLNKGEAELAIRVGEIADENLIARKIGTAVWSLYASNVYVNHKGSPKTARSLAGHDLLGFEPRLAAIAAGAKWIAAHGQGAKIVMIHRELADMIAAAVAGVGLAILPRIIADLEPGLQRLTDEVLGEQAFFVVYRREVALARPVQQVIRFLIDVMRLETVPTRRS